MQRPDLNNIPDDVLAYIEYLEKKVNVRSATGRSAPPGVDSQELAPERASETLPAEQETLANIITFTNSGSAKRTLRHLYTRQHRGGMGVFEVDIVPPDAPVFFASAEENQHLLIFTNLARVFRQPLNAIPSGPVFSKAVTVIERLGLEAEEQVIAILPEQAKGYVAFASQTGRVRLLRHHLFGEHMRAGTAFYHYADFGPLAAVCWTTGDAELFLVTRQGMGIRFAEKAIAPQGDQGIRLASGDALVAITPIFDDSGVFIAGADGRGTVRLMSGFAANKTPGGSGKIAFRSEKVIGAAAIEPNDDLFLLSRLGKAIRFPADEVAASEGVVQGVNCMGLRGDEVVACLRAGPIY